MTDKTEAMDLAKTLDELSKAATQGACSIGPGANSHCFDGQLLIGDTCIGFVEGDETIDGDGDYHIEPGNDALFIIALWNAYRTGKLVVVPDDAVDVLREARSGLCAFTGGADGACSETIARIDRVLAALKGADHAG